MERVNDTLRRQQAESLNFELKDGSKFQRELERVFEELDQISIKQVKSKLLIMNVYNIICLFCKIETS